MDLSHRLRGLFAMVWAGGLLLVPGAHYGLQAAQGTAGNPGPGQSTPMWSYLVPLAVGVLALAGVVFSTLWTNRKQAAGKTAGIVRIHQLAAPPADFTGRADELEALKSGAAAGTPTAILGLFGMGGVGKTALALKLAEEISGNYPDGQIYLDLQGVTTPMAPVQVANRVVRSFVPKVPVLVKDDEIFELYRALLHGKRVLVVFDNAAGQEQVEPLVPPQGCAMLITSRLRFTLPGLVAEDLDRLPDADARALLLRISPRIGPAAAELARLCDGLPLALRVVGGTLAERPDLSPGTYVRRLAEGAERLGPVDASLAVSYDLLAVDLRRLWRLLAVFPGSFDKAAAASIWELEEGAAENALGKLMTNSLLDWEESIARYRLHDLARSFANRQLDEAEREAARRRHAAHYVEILRQADSLFQQVGEALVRGLSLFDVEWSNIRAGQAWAAAQPAGDTQATELCDAYPKVGPFCLGRRVSPRERVLWREAAISAARRRQNTTAEAAHLGYLGMDYLELGDSGRAIELEERSLAICRNTGDRRGEGSALNSLGLTFATLGDNRRAIEYYEQRLTMSRDTDDRRGEAAALTNLGLAYAAVGETDRAIELYERRLAIARDSNDRREEGNILNNLGLAYAARANTRDIRHAIKLYERGLAIGRATGDRQGTGETLTNLGLAYAGLGKFHRAIKLHMQSIAIAHVTRNHVGESSALANMGLAYAALGKTRRAIEVYEQQLALARESDDRWSEGNASWNLGIEYEKDGNLARAAELMQVLVDLERGAGHADAARDAEHLDDVRARLTAGAPPGPTSEEPVRWSSRAP